MNSVEVLTSKVEENTEPSLMRNHLEGVTTTARA